MYSLMLVAILYLPLIVLLGVVAAPPSGGQVVSKPLSWFKVKSNSRKRFEEAALQLLGKDLRVRQLQPLVCLPDGTIVCGERRYRAAVLEGLESLLVMVITDPIDQEEHYRLQLVENLLRADLSNAEKCIGCCNYANSNPSLSLKDIANQLRVDASMVTRWRAWEKCTEAVRQALIDEKITLAAMYEISKLPQEGQAAALDKALGKRKQNEDGEEAVKVKKMQCQMPSGAVVTLARKGGSLTLSEVIEELATLLKKAKRAAEQGLDCKTFGAVLRDEAKAS